MKRLVKSIQSLELTIMFTTAVCLFSTGHPGGGLVLMGIVILALIHAARKEEQHEEK